MGPQSSYGAENAILGRDFSRRIRWRWSRRPLMGSTRPGFTGELRRAEWKSRDLSQRRSMFSPPTGPFPTLTDAMDIVEHRPPLVNRLFPAPKQAKHQSILQKLVLKSNISAWSPSKCFQKCLNRFFLGIIRSAKKQE